MGKFVDKLLNKAIELWPDILRVSTAILQGQKTTPWEADITRAVRNSFFKMLTAKSELPNRTARATTPLSPQVHQTWGDYTEDKDSHILAAWLQTGAPLGFAEDIPTTGVFPRVTGPKWEDEALKALSRSLEGWQKY